MTIIRPSLNYVSGVLKGNSGRVLDASSGTQFWLKFSSISPFVVPERPQREAVALLCLCSSWRPAALYGELQNGKAANRAWCNLHLIDEGLRILETINLYQDSCGPKSKRLCHWYPILIFALINHLPFYMYFVFRTNFFSHTLKDAAERVSGK